MQKTYVHVPMREIHSSLERSAVEMREGLIAYEHDYNLATVLSLAPLSQEIYWKLKNGEEG